MKCVFCGGADCRVVDSRVVDDGKKIRRRRECCACGGRFTTFEQVEELPIVVIKRDGRREVFEAQKILKGLIIAGQKREIPLETLRSLVDELERVIRNRFVNEITTDEIGEIVLSRLREIDEVAYVRFASVFRQFKDINSFKEELEKLERLSGEKES